MGISGIESKTLLGKNELDVSQFFMEHGKLYTFPKNSIIYSTGESAQQIYFINHGEVRISRSTNDGKEIILDILGPGDTFGEITAIRGSEQRNIATAKKDLIIHSISRDVLLDLILDSREVALWAMEKITREQIKTENLLEKLLFKSATAKVANLLLELAKTYGVDDERGLLIDYPITHQEIGNIIATTRETVSYTFMEFRQLGLIDTVKRRTIILDKPGLEEMAEN